MLKGLIFDLDGVIADTARFHLAAWRQLAESLGITLPAAADADLRGRSRESSLAVVLRYGAREYSPKARAAMAAQKNRWYQEAIATLTPQDILPGISQLLADAASRDLPLALASASKNAPAILERLGLSERFARVVDPASLHAGKPDPEIFLKAQALLGATAAEVISFEDAAAGVAAIKAAGQFAVGIGDAEMLAAADYQVATTAQLELAEVIAAYETVRFPRTLRK